VARYSELYYRCNRILAEIFTSDEMRGSLALPKRLIYLNNVSRHVTPRPIASHANRSRLHMAPAFLHHSEPEPTSIHQLKKKVCFALSQSMFFGLLPNGRFIVIIIIIIIIIQFANAGTVQIANSQ